MDNVLKLTVKKDVFDKLASGEQSYIYVESNGYWIRRLAVNSVDSFEKLKETQAFRTFDYVSVTCAKENAEYQFKSIRTGYEDMTQDGIDTGICVWITGNKDEVNEPESESVSIPIDKMSKEEAIETMSEVIEEYKEDETTVVSDTVSENEPINEPINDTNGEPINDTNNEHEYIEDETETDVERDLTTDLSEQNGNDNIDDVLSFMIDIIGKYDNVVVVNRANLIITSNGRIFGTKDKIDINNEEEIRVSIGSEKVYDDTNSDDEFIKKIESYLCDYAKNGYVFIYKDGCGLVNTSTGRYYKFRMSKKMYMNR